MNLRNIIKKSASPSLMKDERGLSTVEYVILLVLIAAACVGLWVTLSGSLKAKMGEAQGEIDKVTIGEGSGDPDNE